MADVLTAAIQATRSLHESIKRYKDRNKTLQRLQVSLEDLTNILESLKELCDAEGSMFSLLQGLVNRCRQVCSEFEQAMEAFSGKAKTGLRDWARMEFMRGDINDFIDTITEYKATISVALGTITVQNSKVSLNAIEGYDDIIKDTAYNLELRLQRIDDKILQLTEVQASTLSVDLDLQDERQVTEQCLRICEKARSFIESLSRQESSLLQESSIRDAETQLFEAQSRTRQALDGNQEVLAAAIVLIKTRLESLSRTDRLPDEDERQRLQSDIDVARQCLDVCKMAGEISRQKACKIGEVVADGDSDQVVVNTVAEIFDVKRAISKNRSAQLVGSMEPEDLRYLTDRRYSSRFATSQSNPGPSMADVSTSSTSFEVQRGNRASPQQVDHQGMATRATMVHQKPNPNEVRKRTAGEE